MLNLRKSNLSWLTHSQRRRGLVSDTEGQSVQKCDELKVPNMVYIVSRSVSKESLSV